MKGVRLLRLLQDCDPSWRLIGRRDALMSPWELQSSGSRWSYSDDSGAPGITWLVWLAGISGTPPAQSRAQAAWYGTARSSAAFPPCYRLTQDGLLEAVHHLMRGGAHR